MALARSFAPPRFLIWLFPLLVLVPAIDRAALDPPPHGGKPIFPVSTALLLVGAPPDGGKARVIASIAAWAPGEPIEWRLEIPEDVRLLAGPPRWSGTLDRGETLELELVLELPDGTPREIRAAAALPGRPRATSGAALTIDPGLSDAAPSTLEVGSGEAYLQYRGEVQPR